MGIFRSRWIEDNECRFITDFKIRIFVDQMIGRRVSRGGDFTCRRIVKEGVLLAFKFHEDLISLIFIL